MSDYQILHLVIELFMLVLATISLCDSKNHKK